ncbi:unnamed protein product [Meganyctiphanes norvegica]|uniref:Secreted protein n=1 Tax=Meganyctiphanes norvegica TaxID=48144 RepID=A0AAV2RGV8_MEGNR
MLLRLLGNRLWGAMMMAPVTSMGGSHQLITLRMSSTYGASYNSTLPCFRRSNTELRVNHVLTLHLLGSSVDDERATAGVWWTQNFVVRVGCRDPTAWSLTPRCQIGSQNNTPGGLVSPIFQPWPGQGHNMTRRWWHTPGAMPWRSMEQDPSTA